MDTRYPHIDDRTRCATCGVDIGPEAPDQFGFAQMFRGMVIPRLCDGCLLVERAQRDAEARVSEKSLDIERRSRRVRRVLEDIPRHFRPVAEEGFGPLVHARVARREAIEEARNAVSAPAVLLCGRAGAGKTTLAAGMVGDIIARALAGDRSADLLISRAVWIEAADLVRARRAHRLGEGEAPEIREAMGASLLVVDDLGQEKADPDGALTDLLWHRHAEEIPTVWTTGLGGKDIEARYGSGFLRRLSERGYATIIRADNDKPRSSSEAA